MLQSKWSLFIGFFALIIDVTALSGYMRACIWSSNDGKLDGYIPGNFTSTILVTNGVGECQNQCVSQSTFICAAVNYRVSDGSCELLVENNQTASVVESVNSTWQYFIRPLCAGIWLPWTSTKGRRIPVKGFHGSTEPSLQDCMGACLGFEGNVECRAINIRTTTEDSNCKLHSLRVEDADKETKDNSNFQYFNRPIWYLDSSPARTQAEMRDFGNIGYYMYVFTEVKVPVSGYLVGWQYYMNTNNPCTSYAAIWRQVGTYTYKLISKTLLSPEQPTEPGVRFQFVQNEVIRVQQGDVLAVHTEGKDGGNCQNNVVSGSLSDGNKTLVFENSDDPSIDNTMTFSLFSNMSPALRAYVSEYQFLGEKLFIVTNSSTTSSDIQLRLPPMPKTEEAAVIVGYKLICSMDANLTQIVSCYDGLLPVNTRDVFLSLPDVPGTYHIAVQMVRNFNGKLLLEDKYNTTIFDKVSGHSGTSFSILNILLIAGVSVLAGCLCAVAVAVINCWRTSKRRNDNSNDLEEKPAQNDIEEIQLGSVTSSKDTQALPPEDTHPLPPEDSGNGTVAIEGGAYEVVDKQEGDYVQKDVSPKPPNRRPTYENHVIAPIYDEVADPVEPPIPLPPRTYKRRNN